MQGKHLYEYAVLRVVPRVEREEFMNIGVVLFCSGLQFLQMRYVLDAGRLASLYPELDIKELETYCRSFSSVCTGDKKGGVLESMPAASRFRWLTAKRSAILQVSAVHPGFCLDPSETIEELMDKLVR
jgi:hypothetical protein